MANRVVRKRLILSTILASAFFISASSLVVAQDVSKLVNERCTECHKASRWEDQKKTEKQWAKIVDQMVRYGAQLKNDESALVVEYLTAKSLNKIKDPTTTTTAKPKATTTTKKVAQSDINAAKTTTTTAPTNTTTTTAPTTATTVEGTAVSVPAEQAQTGVEMLWYLLGGGMLIGSGMSLRNRDRQLRGRD